jgi:hypothetical protein
MSLRFLASRTLAAAFGLWLFGPCAFGQNIRGLLVEQLRVRVDTAYEKTVAIALDEMAALSLDSDSRFLRGLRLELHLSNLLKQHFDSFGLAVYCRVEPEPRKGVFSYRGERILFQPLPYLNRMQVTLPLGTGEDLEPAAEGSLRLRTPLAREDFPILVEVLPLTKGIPDTVAESKFFLTVRPVVAHRGLLQLALHYPEGSEGEPLALYLDERELAAAEAQSLKTGLELPSGLHRLRAASHAFHEVNSSFTVEPGKSSLLEVQLERLATLLTIEAPQSAEVFLDGQRLTALAGLSIEEGAHQVRVKVGDYSVSRKFSAQRGRHYHLSCVFDIIVNED